MRLLTISTLEHIIETRIAFNTRCAVVCLIRPRNHGNSEESDAEWDDRMQLLSLLEQLQQPTAEGITTLISHNILLCTLGTCKASRFDSNSNRPLRFDSTVMGQFENFRIGRVCPLLVVVRRLKPLMALSGTVYRLASSMSDHTPVLFNVFEPLSMLLTGITICA